MDYKVLDIEGVGTEFARKLNEAGIKTVSVFLIHIATPGLRSKLAKETGISPKLILKWANHADLFRIRGIGPQFAEMLEYAGVDTVKELKNRVSEHLQRKLAEVNVMRHIAHRVPSVKEVSSWISEAKRLDPILTY